MEPVILANIILIEKNGDPNFIKLLDFGLVKMEFETRLTQSGNFLGIFQYLAPALELDTLVMKMMDKDPGQRPSVESRQDPHQRINQKAG